MLPSLTQIIETMFIGLGAGILGGLAGVGGSMIILPALHVFYPEDTSDVHHRYMAAAMLINLIVAFPAARRHRAHDGVRQEILRYLIPTTSITVFLGVLTSNLISGDHLKNALAAFIALYCAYNLFRLSRTPTPHDAPDIHVKPWRLITTGSITGLIAGLLGLGGGVIMVPLLQLLCKVRLRKAIGTSSAVMVITACFGAGTKLLTLYYVNESISHAILLAALMAPGALVGSWWGASLTHRLPIRVVRAAITVLLLIAAWRLIA